MQHYLFRTVWQSNFSAPMESELKAGGFRILENECESGAWLLDMAAQYPLATFIGTTTGAISQERLELPNAMVLRTSLLDGIPFPDETFDLVTQQFMFAPCHSGRCPDAINEMVRVAKNGAWLELMVVDLAWYNTGPASKRITKAYSGFLSSRGHNGFDSSEL